MIWLAFIHIFFSQPHSPCIVGNVHDQYGDPALFASIKILQNGKDIAHSQTDFDGNYEICDLPPAQYQIQVSYVGTTTVTKDIVITDSIEKTKVDIILISNNAPSECVVVDYKVPLVEQNLRSKSEPVSSSEISNEPVRSINSIATKTAGLASNAQDSQVNIRGRRDNQSNYYIDGIRVNGKMIPDKKIRKRFRKSKNKLTNKSNTAQKKSSTLQDQQNAFLLTATEWNPISEIRNWESFYESGPMERIKSDWTLVSPSFYTVQLLNQAGTPVVDHAVKIDISGKESIYLRSNNIGNIVVPDYAESDTHVITIEDQTYTFDSKKKRQNIKIHLPLPCTDINHAVDIAFVMDITGSMSDELTYLQNDISALVKDIDLNTDLDLRLGSCFFTDGFGQHSYQDFTSDYSEFNSFLQSFSSSGGSEVMDQALDKVIYDFDWSEKAKARILFLFIDFSYDEQSLDKPLINRAINKAKRMGIQIIPIAGSGLDKPMEYLMKHIAIQTNGSYVTLTDHSGIGGTHLSMDSENTQVEILNDLIYDLIMERIEVSNCQEISENNNSDCRDHYVLSSTVTSHNIKVTTKLSGDYLISNINGLQVSQGDFRGDHWLDINTLPSGQYNIQFYSDKNICSKKFIVLSNYGNQNP